MISQPKPKIERAYQAPHLRVVGIKDLQIHAADCGCRKCEPDRLTAIDMGKLASAAAVVVTGIMLAIDPAGTIAALRSTIGF